MRNDTFIGDILAYMKKNKKLGSVTRFRIGFNGYVIEETCAEMWLLRQSF